MIDYHKTMELGRKLLDKHGLSDWQFDVQNLENSNMHGSDCEGLLGCCNHDTKTILVHCYAGQKTVRQTILHEIAHALTPGDGHGKIWWDKASSIGYTFTSLALHTLAMQQEKK